MGRRVPSEANPLIQNHPVLSLSLHIAWIAATMAIITALCGSRSKRSSSPSPTASVAASSMESTETTQQPTTVLLPPTLQKTSEKTPQVQEQQQQQQSSTTKPPSPKSEEDISTNVPSTIVNRTTSKRNLMVSLSMKIPEAISKIRTAREDRNKQQEEIAPQDSLWMKTIILGDRCRVPSDDEDDAVIIDDKGRRVPVYQPKTSRSLPVSRTNSYIDPNTLPMRRKGLLDDGE